MTFLCHITKYDWFYCFHLYNNNIDLYCQLTESNLRDSGINLIWEREKKKDINVLKVNWYSC